MLNPILIALVSVEIRKSGELGSNRCLGNATSQCPPFKIFQTDRWQNAVSNLLYSVFTRWERNSWRFKPTFALKPGPLYEGIVVIHGKLCRGFGQLTENAVFMYLRARKFIPGPMDPGGGNEQNRCRLIVASEHPWGHNIS